MALISKEHRNLNYLLHRSRRGMGASGHRWAEQVRQVIDRFAVISMLDYGCGQSTLWKELSEKYPVSVDYHEYDPCIPKKSKLPHPADLVTCTDVLEHVEPEYLDNVLAHIHALTRRVLYLNIALHMANKKLPDGRNAHLIIQSKRWWNANLRTYFYPSEWILEPLESKRPEKDYIVLLYRIEMPE